MLQKINILKNEIAPRLVFIQVKRIKIFRLYFASNYTN